ncbi:MAG: histidine phosphatase family protein [Planctomycetota bacterium]
MLRVVLIRPGTTDYDEQGRIKGRLDIPMNQNGEIQVTTTTQEVSELGIEVVYSGPCTAAQQTAKLIAEKLDVRMKEIKPLQNLDPGLWQGKLIEEVKTQHPKIFRRWQEQPETMCPPEGEMLEDAQQRLQEAVAKLYRKNKDKVIAVVMPEPIASILRAMLINEELGDLWQAETTCGHWELIEVNPASPVAL